MRNLQRSPFSKSALFLGTSLLGILLGSAGMASAQAMVSAQRGAEIAPFYQTTIVSPDWGPTNNFGYTFGVDYTRFVRLVLQPSLEFRMTGANGQTVGEHAYTAGFKLQTTVHGVHPYVTLLGGYGDITFTHPTGNYTSDNSMIYSLGAGAEFNVIRNLKLRVDFTHQQWNIDPQTLTPVTIGVGVAYSLPFFHGGAVQ